LRERLARARLAGLFNAVLVVDDALLNDAALEQHKRLRVRRGLLASGPGQLTAVVAGGPRIWDYVLGDRSMSFSA